MYICTANFSATQSLERKETIQFLLIMKTNLLFLMLGFLLLPIGIFAQSVPVSFTGRDAANNYVQLDRVVITNQTKGWTETIYWPDTTLTMQNGTGIDESVASGGFGLSRNNPNPFSGTTDVNLTVADAGAVTLEIVDGNGRIVGANNYSPLPTGIHQFRITLSAAGTYVMTARQNGKTSAIKMVNNGTGNGNRIEYVGMSVETMCTSSLQPKSTTDHPFDFGDQMDYVGYATINGEECESQHISQAQETAETLVLQFAETQLFVPTVITDTVSNISDVSATCGGNVISDGGDSVIARGVCWSTSPSPTITNSHTTDSCGTGIFTNVLTGLTPATTYYVRAYATNSVGTAYGEEVNFITESRDAQPCPGLTTVFDIDGNVYNTVQIGAQCWMKENLKTTKYANNTPITQWNYTATDDTPYWFYPAMDASNKTTYGLLYNWSAVMHGTASSEANPSGVQGICPARWHVPSDAEWTQLTNYVRSVPEFQCGDVAGKIAKALAARTGWDSYLVPCVVGDTNSPYNASGFSALPASTVTNGSWYGFGLYAYFWSSTESGARNASYRSLERDKTYVINGAEGKEYGFSVRCILDTETQLYVPTISTAAISDVTATSAICGGEVMDIGSDSVTARGVCWSTVQHPTIADSHTIDGDGLGAFMSNLTGLSGATTYYVRAYAMNSVGLAYGEEMTFTTIDTTIGFIPDGPNCDNVCYSSYLNITSHSPNAMITRPSDILSVRINIEHSSIGDLNISIVCPNGNSILLIPDHNGYNNASDFGIANTSGSGCSAANIPHGTGWNYCWSENTDYAQISGYCYNSANIGNDNWRTVDSSHLAHSLPGQNDFVMGQQYYSPYQSFANLVGCPVNGLWQIQVCDVISGDNGYIFGWDITFTSMTGDSSSTNISCQGADSLIDIDGNVYNTIQIGYQCWMKENLRTTRYANGDTVPYFYAPSADVASYGYLYYWLDVMNGAAASEANPSGVQGICPDGWHVPSDAEWTQLTEYVSRQNEFICGSSNDNIAKSLAANHSWHQTSVECAVGNNLSTNNATGFSVLPAGCHGYGDDQFGDAAGFHCTTADESNSLYRTFGAFNSVVGRHWGYITAYPTAVSVRCLRD